MARDWAPSEPLHTSGSGERHGPLLQRQSRLTDAQVAEMATKYTEGATCAELAAEYGCKRTTVANQLRQHGTVLRRRSPEQQDIERFIELYNAGISLAKVAKETGFATRTIQRYLNESRVYRRGPYNLSS